MTKTKVLATPRSTNTKNKPILKKHNMDNKISIKKISNEKEIVAEFPLITDSSGNQVMSVPIFRKDKQHFTPGFSLADEFTHEYRVQHQVLQQYRVASESSVIELENIRLPKPSSRNSYCTICKVRFDDYRDHIKLDEHINKMRSSPYCKQIEEMALKKKIQRYSILNEKIDKTETSLDERTNQDVFISRIDRKSISDTKQSLYQMVNQQCKRYRASSSHDVFYPTGDNLYDVLY